jgi:hypothetical protein
MTESIDIFHDIIIPLISKLAKGFFAPGKLIIESIMTLVVARHNYNVHLVPEIFVIFSKQAEAV